MHNTQRKTNNLPPPFKTKVIERISLPSKEKRKQIIKDAGYNPFLIPARDVFIDLLSDSGTSALSKEQLSLSLLSDESFAYQNGYYTFIDAIEKIIGKEFITYPLHQGRGIEALLFKGFLKRGDIVVSNAVFETTAYHIEQTGAKIVNLPVDESKDEGSDFPFKANLNLGKLQDTLKKKMDNVAFIILMLTDNNKGGQPISLKNLEEISQISKKFKIPLIIDGARFAENAYLIKEREFPKLSIKSIAKRIFSAADIFYISAKKDVLSPAGAILGIRKGIDNKKLEEKILAQEGFITHGGLSDADLMIISQGFLESLDEKYLRYRISQVRRLYNMLNSENIPVIHPCGGNGVYIISSDILPDRNFPGYEIGSAVYIEGGVRGSVFGGKFTGGKEYFRLAIPRRAYFNEHIDYAGKIIIKTIKKGKFPHLQLKESPSALGNFLARFKMESQ